MDRFFIFCVSLLLTFTGFAQLDLPRISPLQKIEQHIGLTDITIEYCRPSIKGRKIFGELVPYDKYWRTGANRNTKITFSENVQVGGGDIAAGSYAIFTKPSLTTWDVYFYKETDNWEVPEIIDSSKIAALIRVQSKILERTVENLTISFDDMTADEVKLGIAWENTYVAIPVNVQTDKIMADKIQQTKKENALGYHLAGYYYLRENKNLEEAKALFQTAIQLNNASDYRNHLQLAYVLEKLDEKEAAIQQAKKSLALAKSINSKYGINESTALLKKWDAWEE